MLLYTTDFFADKGYGVPDLGPNVSKVNLHTALWTLFEIYEEDAECGEMREIFQNVIE